MAKQESRQAKQERLEINKKIGNAKKLAKQEGIKKGKKRGLFYGMLAALLGSVVIGGAIFTGITVTDYEQNKDKTPKNEIGVTALGNIILIGDQKVPNKSQVATALLSKNPKIDLGDFIITKIKVDGSNGTAKVISSHWWVGNSVEVTFTVSHS